MLALAAELPNFFNTSKKLISFVLQDLFEIFLRISAYFIEENLYLYVCHS